MRIVIAGVPRAGKTTLSKELGEQMGIEVVQHIDTLISLGWSEASAVAATWFDQDFYWIVEGVAAGRALRKWMDAHPTGKPCDVVYWMPNPRIELSGGQAVMAKGCLTVWAEIVDKLRSRDVSIHIHV